MEPATFTPRSFQELVRLLEQHPEWRADLRRLILSDDLLELPTAVRELADAQRRTEEQLAALVEAQRRTEERLATLEQRMAELAEAQRRTEERLAELDQRLDQLTLAQHDLTLAMRALVERVDRNETRLDEMVGVSLEQKYRSHTGGYFGRLLRRARPLSQDELDDLIDSAIESGTLRERDGDELRWADIIVRGRRREDGEPAFLAVEVSYGIGTDDVMRAADRADILRRVRPATGVVAGEWITGEAKRAAKAAGVWHVLDGSLRGPDDPE